MAAPKSTIPYRNRLLCALSRADLGLLQPHLGLVALALRQDLERPNSRIEYVYFMEAGVASVAAVADQGRRIEVGLIGSEGMTGATIVLGDHRSPNATTVQVVGAAQRIRTAEFRRAMAASPSMRALFLKFVQAFLVQTAQTAAANGRGRLDERLARWILMAHDRVGHDRWALTHELLALMLGVRRPGVTEALNGLEGEGMIKAARGEIVVLDRKAIERRAGNFYGVPEAEYRRLIG